MTKTGMAERIVELIRDGYVEFRPINSAERDDGLVLTPTERGWDVLSACAEPILRIPPARRRV